MFIYVIGPEIGSQKIGFSSDVERRLKALQTGHPEKLFIHHKVSVEKARVRLLERIIHKENRHIRLTGEWFNFTPKEAQETVDHAIIRYLDDSLLKFYV